MLSSVPPAPHPVPATNLTLLTLPLEIRLQIYEYLHGGSLALRRPKSTIIPLVARLHLPSSVAILQTCRQLRDEATPVFYKSVFLGEAITLSESYLPGMNRLCRGSVQEALIEGAQNTSTFCMWLRSGNPFSNLKRCKISLESGFPVIPPIPEGKIAVLELELANCQRVFFSPYFTKRPMPSVEVELTIYLTRIAFRKIHKHGLAFRRLTGRSVRKIDVSNQQYRFQPLHLPFQHFDFDVMHGIRGKSSGDLLALARKAVEGKDLMKHRQKLEGLTRGKS